MIKDQYGYIPLIEDFLNKKISAKEFDDKFFEKVGSEEEPFIEGNDLDDLIDELCYYVDAYVDDETLAGGEDLEPFERTGEDLDEPQLRAEVTRIYNEIQKLKKPASF